MDSWLTNVEIGDIITVRSHRNDDVADAIALVMEASQGIVSCVWVHTDLEAATERDIILESQSTGLPYVVVLMTMAEVLVSIARVVRRLGSVDKTVRDEIVLCRYGEPSANFEHGIFMKPFGLDIREAELTARIREYIDLYGEVKVDFALTEETDDVVVTIIKILDSERITPEQFIILEDYIEMRKDKIYSDGIAKVLAGPRAAELLELRR